MISDLLFVYGTLMRGFDHPMARLLSRNADFLGEARCRGRLYRVKHYPGLVLSDDADRRRATAKCTGCAQPEELLREFDMYEACGEGFAEPTEYVRRMLPVTLDRRQRPMRGLDLHLQLAGRALPRIVGPVSGEVGSVMPGLGRASTSCVLRAKTWMTRVKPGDRCGSLPITVDLALDIASTLRWHAAVPTSVLERRGMFGTRYSNQARKSKGVAEIAA